MDLGGVEGGIEDLALLPPVQQTSTVWIPSAWYTGHRARPLGGLVVGMGVDGQQAERIRHADHATGQ